MNEITHRGWGVAVKAWAAVLALSLLILMLLAGLSFWQIMQGMPREAAQTQAAQAILRLPADARHLARLARVALDGEPAEEEFRTARAVLASGIQQVMVEWAGLDDPQDEVHMLIDAWAEMDTAAGQLHEWFDLSQEMPFGAERFEAVAAFKEQLDALVREMVSSGSASSQVYLALHQVVLLDEMLGRVKSIREGNERALQEAAELVQDIEDFNRVLTGLQRGDAGIALRRLQGKRVRATLAQVQGQWEALHPVLRDIARQAPLRVVAQSALLVLERSADTVSTSARLMIQDMARPPSSTPPGGVWVQCSVGTLALLSGFGLWQALRRRRRYWREQVAQLRHREQDALAQLLDEMGALAEGDFTVKATFSDDVSGMLADSINFISQQLGVRIQAMTALIMPFPAQAEAARGMAIRLSEVSQYQQQELSAALVKAQQLKADMDAIALQMADPGRSAGLDATHACSRACADLVLVLDTLYTITRQLAAEAKRATTSLDALAQSAASLRTSADSFILPG